MEARPTLHSLIAKHRADIRALAERHGIRDVRVFGSMARHDETEAGDVDSLVSLSRDKTRLALGAPLIHLQILLQRPVDVLTEAAFHPRIRDQVLSQAVRL